MAPRAPRSSNSGTASNALSASSALNETLLISGAPQPFALEMRFHIFKEEQDRFEWPLW